MQSRESTTEISVVIPLLDEEANLADVHRRVTAALEATGKSFEVLFVDDGSRDATSEILDRLARTDPRVRAIRFARNYGQHHALLAGLRHARGRAVVTMDADLQMLPEDIPALLEKLGEGFEIVFGTFRTQKQPPLRRLTSALVRRILRREAGLPPGVRFSPFRVIDRRLVERLVSFTGSPVQLEALIRQSTSSMAAVEVRHEPRHAGRTKYDAWRRLRFGLLLVMRTTLLPLRAIALSGAIAAAAGVAIGLAVLVRGMVAGSSLPALAVACVLGGAVLLAIAALGEYVELILRTVSHEPQYFVRALLGGDAGSDRTLPRDGGTEGRSAPPLVAIRGALVTLRPFAETDLAPCLAWVNDPGVARLVNRFRPVAPEEHLLWYRRVILDPSRVFFAIDARDGGRYVGNCGFRDIDLHARKADLWIYIGEESFRGRGLGIEACRLLVRYGFDQLNLNRIYLYVADYNPVARALYHRLGFTEEGVEREAIYLDGQYHDAVRMALLRSELRSES